MMRLYNPCNLCHGDDALCLQDLVEHLLVWDRPFGLVELPLSFTPLPVQPPFATEGIHFIQTLVALSL